MRVVTRGREERFGYFAWALENLPELQDLTNSLAYVGTGSIDATVHSVVEVIQSKYELAHRYSRFYGFGPYYYNERWTSSFDREIALDDRSYVELVGADAGRYLDNPADYYAADDATLNPALDAAAYKLMLFSFLGAFDSRRDAVLWLSVLLLRGTPNRQMTIARFLSLATRQGLGLAEGPIPSMGEIVSWVERMRDGNTEVERTLPALVAEYIYAAQEADGER
jgi:hypothetical protein